MAGKYGDFEEKLKKTVEHFRKDLTRIRTGRATTSLLDGIMVDYYGSQTPLIQLGMVNAPEPRMLTIQVYDASAVDGIEKAIKQSDLGLNPSREGNLIRLNIPPLTEERRKEIVKRLHKDGEEAKVTIRNHRREAMDLLKGQLKDKKVSEDDAKRGQDEIQKITDRYIADIDTALGVKEKEVMEV